MFDPELEKTVALCKSADPLPMKKHEMFETIRRFANRQRQPGESIQKAVSRFITQDPDGKVLYKSFAAMKGAQATIGPNDGTDGFPGSPKFQTGRSGNEAADDDDGDETEGLKTLRAIADTIR